jgi:hypothetical protein
MAEAYPLHWPEGHSRTPTRQRERGKFKTSFTDATYDLVHELELMGARYPVISTNVPLRRDGLPYSPTSLTAQDREAAKDDPGAAVYFEWKGEQYAFACDRWERVEGNVRAIGLTVGALRGLDRWGTGEMMRASFHGFKALPEPEDQEAWWKVLGVEKNDMTLEGVESQYKHLAKKAHPDAGGSHEQMQRLNRAMDQARKELEGQ